jgi:hypothetical protein
VVKYSGTGSLVVNTKREIEREEREYSRRERMWKYL